MSMKTCPQCGTQQDVTGQAFCSNCGAPLDGATTGSVAALPEASVTIAPVIALQVSGADGTSSLTYPGHEILIGRRDEPTRVFPDLVVDDPLVSRRHLAVWQENGQLLVQDLLSANGTTLNGSPLPKGEARPLQGGDVLTLPGSKGQTTLTVQVAP